MSYLKVVFSTYKWMGVPFVGLYIATVIEKAFDDQMVAFRDKSALYGKVVPEGKQPSW